MIWRTHNRERLLEPHCEKIEYLESIRADHLRERKKPRSNGPTHQRHAYVIMATHVHHNDRVGESVEEYSGHLRRAHSRFCQGFNRRKNRLGKVACDRPKTLAIQNSRHEVRVMLYMDCNPVRAGITKHPTAVSYRLFSSCRFYALGERTRYTEFLTPPDWYLELGRTPALRQSRYRALLDRYLVTVGLKPDPLDFSGHYLGSESWKAEMRRSARAARQRAVSNATQELDTG